MTQPNPSTAQARVLVDELHRQGVSYAVISPGSRSAAIAIALDQHPAIETSVVLDERSAAFRALGRARVDGSPTVMVCTSGTAVANVLPAVVEADLSLVPLIVLSADRPPDLQQIGANQTIDQTRIFGEKVRWFCQVPAADAGSDWNGYWRGTISQAVARCSGFGGAPGPVHLNISFREPTVPETHDGRTRGVEYPHPIEGREGGAPWQRHSRAATGGLESPVFPPGTGLIIAGEADYDPSALFDAASALRWPVLATATSGLRGHQVVTTYHHLLVDGVPGPLRPELVVTVGRVGPSDRLGAITALAVPQVQIDPWGTWNDPRRHVTDFLQADPGQVLSAIPGGDGQLRERWLAADSAMREALDIELAGEPALTGPSVASAIGNIGCDVLVAASSMPIRDVDAHTLTRARVIANRGASGIDGFVSTALGVASAGGRVLAMSGDLSLLHDAGALSGADVDAVLIVVDNGGGGLFDLLPQAEHAPGFERLFVAPHGRDLVSVGEAFGANASRVETVAEMAQVASDLLRSGGVDIVVVPVDRETDLKQRRSLDEVARTVSAGLR